jgi:hypothetical protein
MTDSIDKDMVKAASEGAVAFDKVVNWRSSVLNRAALVFATPAQESLQNDVGLWDSFKSIPYPSKTDINILKNGCMVFSKKHNQSDIMFGVFMMFGEIRIGVKISDELLNEDARNEILYCYDGTKCERVISIEKSTLYDWIFKTDFANFDNMTRAMSDPLLSAAIATRIGEILTHIYMAVMTSILNSVKRQSLTVKKKMKISGDYESFEFFLKSRNGFINQSTQISKNVYEVLASIDITSVISEGEHHDQDGGIFFINYLG